MEGSDSIIGELLSSANEKSDKLTFDEVKRYSRERVHLELRLRRH